MENCTEILKKNIGVSWEEYDMSACVHGNGRKRQTKTTSSRKKCILVIKQGSEHTEILILCVKNGSTYVNKFFHKRLYFDYKHFKLYELTLPSLPPSPPPLTPFPSQRKIRMMCCLVTDFVFTWRFLLVSVKIHFVCTFII